MAIQTTYSETMDQARAGAIADMTDATLLSYTVEDEALPFGKPVVQGTADKGAHLATTGDTAILGISVRERSTINDEFAIADTARIMTEGAIWVTAAVAVSAGDPVTVVVATATFSNTGGVTIDNAIYETSAGIGELAKVRLA